MRACEPDRARAGDVHDRPRPDASRDGAVKPGGEYIREQREITYLVHRLVPVGKFQKIEVGVRNHHVLGLSSDPSAHVDIAVSGARAGRIHFEANSGLALFAIAAPAACDVERNGDDIPYVDEFDVAAFLDDFTGDLVPQCEPLGSRRTPPDHVLVASTDVGGNNSQNHAVIALAVTEREPRIVD